jgi:hypothetical protein
MPRTFRLRIALDRAYPGVIEEAKAAVQGLVPGNRVGSTDYSGHVEVWAYSNRWPGYLPQHGPGKKHERRIELTRWQEALVAESPFALLRGLFHSDGSRDLNRVNGKTYPRYSFSNLSSDIRDIYCRTCDSVGVHWTVASGGRAINVARRSDVELLDRMIGPKQ